MSLFVLIVPSHAFKFIFGHWDTCLKDPQGATPHHLKFLSIGTLEWIMNNHVWGCCFVHQQITDTDMRKWEFWSAESQSVASLTAGKVDPWDSAASQPGLMDESKS